MFLTVLALGLLITVTSSTTAFSAEYYVWAQKGSDKNAGKSPNAPFATLSHAMTRAGSGSTIHVVRGSIQREAVNFKSGVTVKAFGPEKLPLPVVCGSVEIKNWSEHKGKILKAKVPKKVGMVFINNQMLHLARYPNAGEWLRTEGGTNISTIIDSDLLKHPRNKPNYWKGAQIRWRRWSWHYETRDITGSNGNKLSLGKQTVTNVKNVGKDGGYYIDNKFEELDHPGEWYYDSNEQMLYFYPLKMPTPKT